MKAEQKLAKRSGNLRSVPANGSTLEPVALATILEE
jgi:hypothetical protein